MEARSVAPAAVAKWVQCVGVRIKTVCLSHAVDKAVRLLYQRLGTLVGVKDSAAPDRTAIPRQDIACGVKVRILALAQIGPHTDRREHGHERAYRFLPKHAPITHYRASSMGALIAERLPLPTRNRFRGVVAFACPI